MNCLVSAHLEHHLDKLRLIILPELSQDQLADVLEINHSFLLHLKGAGQSGHIFNVFKATSFVNKNLRFNMEFFIELAIFFYR